MFTRNALLVVSLLVAAPAISAQHSVVLTRAQGPPPTDPGVTLTVTGLIAPGAPGTLPLPAELMERISREEHLTALETLPSPEGRTVIQIRFRFPDIAAFNRWYGEERTVVLLRNVRERTSGGSYESYVSYHPERKDGVPEGVDYAYTGTIAALNAGALESGDAHALIGALAVAVDALIAAACPTPAAPLP